MRLETKRQTIQSQWQVPNSPLILHIQAEATVKSLLTHIRASETHGRKHESVRYTDTPSPSVSGVGLGTYLLCLHKVGHVAIVVHTTGEEASTCTFTADARDETGLGLLVGGIYCADGHHPTNDFQQPVMAAHLVLPQRHMQ